MSLESRCPQSRYTHLEHPQHHSAKCAASVVIEWYYTQYYRLRYFAATCAEPLTTNWVVRPCIGHFEPSFAQYYGSSQSNIFSVWFLSSPAHNHDLWVIQLFGLLFSFLSIFCKYSPFHSCFPFKLSSRFCLCLSARYRYDDTAIFLVTHWRQAAVSTTFQRLLSGSVLQTRALPVCMRRCLRAANTCSGPTFAYAAFS